MTINRVYLEKMHTDPAHPKWVEYWFTNGWELCFGMVSTPDYDRWHWELLNPETGQLIGYPDTFNEAIEIMQVHADCVVLDKNGDPLLEQTGARVTEPPCKWKWDIPQDERERGDWPCWCDNCNPTPF